MSQYVAPISTKNNGGAWSGNINGANLHLDMDEGVATTDDFTSYAVNGSLANGGDTVVVVRLTSLANAPADGTATLRSRTYASQSTNYVHEIRQGYVDESNKGTLLATWSQTHPGDGAWHTATDSTSNNFAGCTDGTILYYRCTAHNNSGSFETVAITAMDADLPNAPTGHNLSGTPDILATTPVTGSGSGRPAWALSGAPNLTRPTGTGSGYMFWNLTGAPNIFARTPLVGAGSGKTIVPIGKLVKVVVDGITQGGFSLQQFDDGTILVAIHIIYDHGRWRWGREVIVSDADDVDLL